MYVSVRTVINVGIESAEGKLNLESTSHIRPKVGPVNTKQRPGEMPRRLRRPRRPSKPPRRRLRRPVRAPSRGPSGRGVAGASRPM